MNIEELIRKMSKNNSLEEAERVVKEFVEWKDTKYTLGLGVHQLDDYRATDWTDDTRQSGLNLF